MCQNSACYLLYVVLCCVLSRGDFRDPNQQPQHGAEIPRPQPQPQQQPHQQPRRSSRRRSQAHRYQPGESNASFQSSVSVLNFLVAIIYIMCTIVLLILCSITLSQCRECIWVHCPRTGSCFPFSSSPHVHPTFSFTRVFRVFIVEGECRVACLEIS